MKTYCIFVSVETNHLELRIRRLSGKRDRVSHVRSISDIRAAFEAMGIDEDDDLVCCCSSSVDFPEEYTSDPCVLDLIDTAFSR